MNTYLCCFLAVVAVANGYSISGGGGSGGYGSGAGQGQAAVLGGLAYQLQPAVTVTHLVSAGGAGAGGYGGARPGAGGYGAAPARPAAPAYRVPAPAPVPVAGGIVDAEALQLARLALSLPTPNIAIPAGYVPAPADAGNSIGPVAPIGYSAVPASARQASAAAASSAVNGNGNGGYGAAPGAGVY